MFVLMESRLPEEFNRINHQNKTKNKKRRKSLLFYEFGRKFVIMNHLFRGVVKVFLKSWAQLCNARLGRMTSIRACSDFIHKIGITLRTPFGRPYVILHLLEIAPHIYFGRHEVKDQRNQL